MGMWVVGRSQDGILHQCLPFSTAARWGISLSETSLLPTFRALAEIREQLYTQVVYTAPIIWGESSSKFTVCLLI